MTFIQHPSGADSSHDGDGALPRRDIRSRDPLRVLHDDDSSDVLLRLHDSVRASHETAFPAVPPVFSVLLPTGKQTAPGAASSLCWACSSATAAPRSVISTFTFLLAWSGFVRVISPCLQLAQQFTE